MAADRLTVSQIVGAEQPNLNSVYILRLSVGDVLLGFLVSLPLFRLGAGDEL